MPIDLFTTLLDVEIAIKAPGSHEVMDVTSDPAHFSKANALLDQLKALKPAATDPVTGDARDSQQAMYGAICAFVSASQEIAKHFDIHRTTTGCLIEGAEFGHKKVGNEWVIDPKDESISVRMREDQLDAPHPSHPSMTEYRLRLNFA